MRYNLTNTEFIDKAIKIHGDKYDYSKVEYIKSIQKVIIICKKCNNEFKQQPNNHLAGYGCSKCAINKTASILKNDINNFIKRANIIHSNYYNYSKTIYNRNNDKVEIICPIHGSFWQKPTHHLNRKQGCGKCSKNISKSELELQEYIRSLHINIKCNDRSFLGNKQELDILIDSHKLAIEFNGMYWHYSKRNKNKKKKGFHGIKSKLCKEKGYKLLHLREDLWLNKKDHMKQVINILLNI